MPRRWSQIAIQYYNVIPQQNTAYRTKESKRILLYLYCMKPGNRVDERVPR